MTLHRIEACWHQDHIWTELLSDGHHHSPTHTHTHISPLEIFFFCQQNLIPLMLQTWTNTIQMHTWEYKHHETMKSPRWKGLPKSSEVLHITHRGIYSSGPRYVHIKTNTCTWSHLQTAGQTRTQQQSSSRVFSHSFCKLCCLCISVSFTLCLWASSCLSACSSSVNLSLSSVAFLHSSQSLTSCILQSGLFSPVTIFAI